MYKAPSSRRTTECRALEHGSVRYRNSAWLRRGSVATPEEMAKPRKRYVCQACGSISMRWQGQCSDCSEWNSLVEDSGAVVTPFSARHDLRSGGRPVDLVHLDADTAL